MKPTWKVESYRIPTYHNNVQLDPQKLSLELDPLSKWGVRLQNSSTYSLKKGVDLQYSSTYSHPKWGPPLEFINIQPPKRGVLHQNSSSYSPPKGVRLQNSSSQRGSASRFHHLKRDPINQKRGPPLGTISMDLVVHVLTNGRLLINSVSFY